jgi:hypothetical protein
MDEKKLERMRVMRLSHTGNCLATAELLFSTDDNPVEGCQNAWFTSAREILI